MSETSRCPERCATVSCSRCAGVSSLCSKSSVMPRTPFIGVRISWLTAARKALLARSASRAASSARPCDAA